MSLYRIKVPQLEAAAQAIGYVCIYWTWLEDAINLAIDKMVPLDSLTILERERTEIVTIISTMGDMRAKMTALRAIAFIRKHDDAWFDKIDKLLAHIDGDLRQARNRFVHDHWTSQKRLLQRRTRVTKIVKPQAFMKHLVTEHSTKVGVKEIWDTGKAIIKAEIALTKLLIEYDEVKSYISAQVQKAQDEDFAKKILGQLVTSPTIPIEQHPQAAPSKTRKGRPASPSQKRRRQPLSSHK